MIVFPGWDGLFWVLGFAALVVTLVLDGDFVFQVPCGVSVLRLFAVWLSGGFVVGLVVVCGFCVWLHA